MVHTFPNMIYRSSRSKSVPPKMGRKSLHLQTSDWNADDEVTNYQNAFVTQEITDRKGESKCKVRTRQILSTTRYFCNTLLECSPYYHLTDCDGLLGTSRHSSIICLGLSIFNLLKILNVYLLFLAR